MYRGMARFAVHNAKAIICVWICLLLVSGLLALRLPEVLSDHGVKVEDGNYADVQRILAEDYHIPNDPVIVLFEKQDSVTDIQLREFVSQSINQLGLVPGVGKIISPFDRQNMIRGNVAYALVPILVDGSKLKDTIEELQRFVPRHSQIKTTMTGKHVVQEEVNLSSKRDLKKAEMIGIPIAFFVLCLAFGGFTLALLPIMVGIITVVSTMGIMAVIGTRMELSIFVLNVIPMVGLALSIDFALIFVSRFREELGHQTNVLHALIHTLRTAGRTVLFSALCVGLGIGGVLWIDMPIFRSIAVGALVVLAMAMLITFTFVPALLSLLAGGIASKISITNDVTASSLRNSLWAKMADFVMRRPLRMLLLASLLLASFIGPLTSMSLAVPDEASLPQGNASRIAAERFDEVFIPPNSSQIYFIAESKSSVLRLAEWKQFEKLYEMLNCDPNVIRIDSIFKSYTSTQLDVMTRSPELNRKYKDKLAPFMNDNRMLFAVMLGGKASSDEAKQWVRDWKERLPDVLIGGEPKYQQEVYDEIVGNLQPVLLFIFASNFLILYLAFGSILIPIKTILMNLLSLGASFGILVWIFEGGLFGIESTSIALMIPVFIFGLTFGISMDYGVFLVSRIYESYVQTKDNDRSVREGLTRSSRVITSAAAIMIAVTLPFALSEVSGVKQLGIGIAAAILIDATIVRMMLVPSLMKLLGKWNWWRP